MFRRILVTALALSAACSSLTTSAVPMLGLDMDPSTPGIQSSLSVPEGSTFSINLVAFDDGTPITPILVDAVGIELLSIPGTGSATFGGATAGSFAALMGPPGLGAIDVGDGMFTGIDASLAALPPTPTPGSLGNFSYFGSPALLSVTTAAVAEIADTFDELMSFSFTAGTAGSMSFSTLGFPPGTELLFSGAGGPLFPGLLPTGLLTITSIVPPPPPPPPPTGAPEPGTIALMALGLLGLIRKKIIR